jgi:protease IV
MGEHACRRTALVVLAFAALAVGGCVNLELPGGPPRPLVETVVYGKSGPKILMLTVEGVIQETPETTSFLGITEEGMVARLREELDKARDDDSIRAVLLRINSPGGTVTASDMIYDEIVRFKKDRGVPVVAQLMGMATSGAYYVAMAADEVIAHPTTVTGSIGVIFLGVNVAGLMDKLGIENQTLVTGPYKDAGSFLRRMKPEERAQLLSVLDDMFARFKDIVQRGRRNLTREQIDTLADGRVYSAPQALANGLVDRVGTIEDAVERAEQRAGLAQARVVAYHRPREYRQNLYTRAPLVPPEVKIDWLPGVFDLPRPSFLYLWAPGMQ